MINEDGVIVESPDALMANAASAAAPAQTWSDGGSSGGDDGGGDSGSDDGGSGDGERWSADDL